MIGTLKYGEHLALSVALAGGLTGFAVSARSHGNSQADIRSAQLQLSNDGYYTGNVDGIDGPLTRSAIRQYQKDNKLTVTGQLDSATCQDLGVCCTGEANRSAAEGTSTNSGYAGQAANRSGESGSNTSTPVSKADIESAQRQLQQKGFYDGPINSVVGPKMEAAIRNFQRSNGLNVNGRLDTDTLNSLGIFDSH